MSPRAIHTVLTEKTTDRNGGKRSEQKKPFLIRTKSNAPSGKNVIVITDRHGQLALQELTPKMG